jgi:CubicO group peptidase (beta-lactamase class C family)
MPLKNKTSSKRWILRTLAALAMIVVVGVGWFVVTEWTYIRRMWTYPKETPVTAAGWYEPKETVPGGPGTPLAIATGGAIAPEVIERAAAYAESKNSTALLVLHRGAIVAERYWRGSDERAWSNSMSMAKTLAALLVGVALQEGRIRSVDEPACAYIPEWAGDRRRRITIRHLLQMCSGLASSDHSDDPTSDIGYLYLGTDALYIVANTASDHEPGTRFDYNSINTQALALIVERATHTRYAHYLSEKIWKPIGASDGAVWLDERGGSAKAFCCMFATARDWARVGLLILHEGRASGRQVVPGAWMREMVRPSPLDADYGYQIWLGNDGSRKHDHEEPWLAPDLVWLDGKYKQRVYIVPSQELVIVRIGEQGRRWDEAFLPNTLIRGLRKRE